MSERQPCCGHCGRLAKPGYDLCDVCRAECDRQRAAADHGYSPAQLRDFGVDLERIVSLNSAEIDALERDRDALREKVEALEHRIVLAHDTSEVARIAFETMKMNLDAAMKRVEELERVNAALLDRVNQLVEYHGILPIEVGE